MPQTSPPRTPSTWGGRREGAGRPRRSDETVPHGARPSITGRTPVQVTLRVCKGVVSLRSQRSFAEVARALEYEREVGLLRVVAFSVQRNRLQMIVECDNADDLSRRMKALGARFAKGMNRRMGRSGGRVLAERYEALVLDSPTKVRDALRDMIHGPEPDAARSRRAPVDPFSGSSVAPLVRGPQHLVTIPRSAVLRAGVSEKVAP